MGAIHYYIKIFLKAILHVYWLFPINREKITLLNELSFTYGDSMKYINEYLIDNDITHYQVIFPIRKGQYIPENNIKPVIPFSISYFFHLLTSKAIVTNAGGVSYLPLRQKQVVISTWHGGGPYKKTSTDVYTNVWYKKESIMNANNIDYMLSSCEYFTKYEAKAMFFSEEKCIAAGMPRNDIFFKNDSSIKDKVYEFCGIKKETKLILFAPTYRVDVSDYTKSKQQSVIDINYKKVIEALENKFSGKWRFAIRLHPKLKDIVLDDNSVINLTDYPDMQEILYASDIVITDYSSLMWDFALSKKPCLLYAPDIAEYELKRGFYMPYKKWPYPLAENNDQLVENILNFNEEKYRENVMKHFEECGCYERGHASKHILDLIEDD